MVYNEELGKEIPKGWEVRALSDIGDVICGKTPPTKNPENYGDMFLFITIPDMHGNTFIIETEKRLSSIGAATQPKKELPPLSVCVSCIATPGLVSLTHLPSHTNQQINSIVCNKDVSPYFTYLTMSYLSDHITLLGSGGTATLNLNKTNFSAIKILVSDLKTMKSFHLAVKNLFEQILINMQETQTLRQIRDALLPKLLSGEIQVNGEKKEIKE
jgi:type I restriction enzyme S subunit